jgi:protoporphyrin/coproporphyrin ferrochelatase
MMPMSSHRTGVLLINLGTPTQPNFYATRAYLKEFLSDPRVIERQNLFWKLLLHGVILTFRPWRCAKRYRKIWMEGSPLLIYSQRLQRLLQEYLGSNFYVVLGMRYGAPSIEDALEKLRAAEITRWIILPLYPQYAQATVASAFDRVTRILKSWRFIPSISFISGYAADAFYIQTLAQHIQTHSSSDDYLLFSYHGLPKRVCDLGDPYFKQCTLTTQLLANALQLDSSRYQQVFQSRFGGGDWLQPYLRQQLISLPRQGIKSVRVVCPGFPVDCLETLEEIALEEKKTFLKASGRRFDYIPAMNDDLTQIKLLADLINRCNSSVRHDSPLSTHDLIDCS